MWINHRQKIAVALMNNLPWCSVIQKPWSVIYLSKIPVAFNSHIFEWTKVYQKCQKWSILAWDLRSISATRQVNINRTKIGGKCQNICFFTWKVSWQFRHLLQSVGVAKCVVWVKNEKSRQFLLKIPPKRKRYFSK